MRGRILNMSILTGDIAKQVGGSLTGNQEILIEDAKSLSKAGLGDISFISDKKNLRDLASSSVTSLLVPESLKDSVSLESHPQLECIIYVPDSQTAIIQLLELIRPRKSASFQGISDQAHVHESARIGDSPEIHAGTIIECDVRIGNNCRIMPGVHIGPGCVIGNDVTLYPNVVLYDGVKIGDRVAIHASSVIGADGFGYRLVKGRHERVPHFGGVRIENDVEIGSCTTVDRGMIDDTVVGEGTKLDNLVMIAHNCQLGKHNIMVSQVGLAGSVTSGDYAVCAGQVGIADHVHLGTQSVLGSKSGVHKNVPDGQTQIGCPAEPAERAMQIMMAQRKLPEIRKEFKVLQKQVQELTQELAKLQNKELPEDDIHSAA